jgi:hypothetical protein
VRLDSLVGQLARARALVVQEQWYMGTSCSLIDAPLLVPAPLAQGFGPSLQLLYSKSLQVFQRCKKGVRQKGSGLFGREQDKSLLRHGGCGSGLGRSAGGSLLQDAVYLIKSCHSHAPLFCSCARAVLHCSLSLSLSLSLHFLSHRNCCAILTSARPHLSQMATGKGWVRGVHSGHGRDCAMS